MIGLVSALDYEYKFSSYTRTLDRTRSLNQTGNNLTIGVINGDSFVGGNANFTLLNVSDIADIYNLIIRSPPVVCPSNSFMTFFNGSNSVCVVDTDNINGTDISINRINASFGNITQLHSQNITTLNLITYNITSPYSNKSYISFFIDGSIGITLDPIYEIIPTVSAQESPPAEQETVTYTPSTETHCAIENGRKKCWVALYSGTRFAQNQSGDWVNPSQILKITKNSDDLTFTYDGIKGDYSITFEIGVIYNGNYYSMYDVKQSNPQIQFNFPTKKTSTSRKYAVNITNIPLAMQPNIQNITLTYKSHTGFTLSQLKLEKGRYLIKDIFELVFDDLKENDFVVKINKAEKRIYIGNLTDKFVDNSLYLDPNIILQDADTENLEDTYIRENSPTGNYGGATSFLVQADSGSVWKVYIKFNILDIPSGQQIDNAILYLWNSASSGDNQINNITVHHVFNQSWKEEVINWNNQPCGISFNDANVCNLIADDGEVPIAFTENYWYTFVVTSAVGVDYNAGDTNVSFILNVSGVSGQEKFPSKEETGDTTLRPYLNITYSELPVVRVTTTLVAPADDSTDEDGDVTFNCSATAESSSLVNISLYHNITGTWKINETKAISGTSDWANFTIDDIANSTNLIWNCLSSNDATNTSFASANYTLNILFPELKNPQFFIQNMSGIKMWWVDMIGNMWLFNDLDIDGNLNVDGDIDVGGTINASNLTSSNTVDVYNLIIRNPPTQSSTKYYMQKFNGTHTVSETPTGLDWSFASLNITDSSGMSMNVSDVLYVNASSGRVGIGTTSPTSKLHVIGNINATGNITSGNSTIILDGNNKLLKIGNIAFDGVSSLVISNGNPTTAEVTIVGSLNVTQNLTINDVLILPNTIQLPASQSTVLVRDDTSGTVGTKFGVMNLVASSDADSGVSYILITDGTATNNNMSLDLHSSLDPNNPLTTVSHYNGDIKGHVWRLNPLGSDTFFKWEVGKNNPIVTFNGTGEIILNNSLFINPNGNIIVTDLIGTYSNGEAYVCVYDNGTLFAKDSACS